MILVNVHASGLNNSSNTSNCENALQRLKRQMQIDLVFSAMKKQRYHEPASAVKVRKKQEARRRRNKAVMNRSRID